MGPPWMAAAGAAVGLPELAETRTDTVCRLERRVFFVVVFAAVLPAECWLACSGCSSRAARDAAGRPATMCSPGELAASSSSALCASPACELYLPKTVAFGLAVLVVVVVVLADEDDH